MTYILKLAAAALVAGALLVPSTACTLNPTITASNAPNACGGTLHFSGTGYTANARYDVQILGLVGVSGWADLGQGDTNSSGDFDDAWGYIFPGPGFCDTNVMTTVTVMGKDLTTGSVTFTTVDVPNCALSPITVGHCG
jgi:hypothetical protein